MFSVLLTALLSVVASEETTNPSYASAYRCAQEEGKPLMVVVGADWCPACVNLKQSTIESLKQAGDLEGVEMAIVNRDVEPGLAGKLMRGPMMPQIIVFSKGNAGSWTRVQLTGFQTRDSLKSLIKRAVRNSGT
ncbi:thioredoxin family protein [Rosistilla carotiformis]|uniref:thioredoxin family protein n=1 Tax=Rosistilla carotiformis TaxID=2528017 RepID=UPI0011A0E9E0|nr:thioredoxin family protein [Rosistilla carotiformis]